MAIVYLVRAWAGEGTEVGIASSVRSAKKILEEHARTRRNAQFFEYNTRIDCDNQVWVKVYGGNIESWTHYTIEPYPMNEVKKRTWEKL